MLSLLIADMVYKFLLFKSAMISLGFIGVNLQLYWAYIAYSHRSFFLRGWQSFNSFTLVSVGPSATKTRL